MEGSDHFQRFGCECGTLGREDTLLLVNCAEEGDAAAILIYEGLVLFLCETLSLVYLALRAW